MSETNTGYPGMPMRKCTCPNRQVLLGRIMMTPESANPNQKRTDAYDVYDYITFCRDGLMKYGHPEVLVNGHFTDIRLDHETKSCIIDGAYLMSLHKLNTVLNHSVTILWLWNKDVSTNVINAARKSINAQKAMKSPKDDLKWYADATAWPKGCYVACDPSDITVETLSRHMALRPVAELDKRCRMDYERFMADVDAGCICDYDGNGEIMLDGSHMTGISVLPDESIAIVGDTFIVPMNLLHGLFKDRISVCWYNK